MIYCTTTQDFPIMFLQVNTLLLGAVHPTTEQGTIIHRLTAVQPIGQLYAEIVQAIRSSQIAPIGSERQKGEHH